MFGHDSSAVCIEYPTILRTIAVGIKTMGRPRTDNLFTQNSSRVILISVFISRRIIISHIRHKWLFDKSCRLTIFSKTEDTVGDNNISPRFSVSILISYGHRTWVIIHCIGKGDYISFTCATVVMFGHDSSAVCIEYPTILSTIAVGIRAIGRPRADNLFTQNSSWVTLIPVFTSRRIIISPTRHKSYRDHWQ